MQTAIHTPTTSSARVTRHRRRQAGGTHRVTNVRVQCSHTTNNSSSCQQHHQDNVEPAAAPEELPCLHRRQALLAALSAVSLAAMAQPSSSPAIAAATDPTFYAQWPYAQPSDILPYIQQQAAPGDAQAVLDAMDAFSEYYPQYKIGPEKGALFEGVLQRVKPTWALEVGTFLGYSAIRTARNLAPGGRLLCIEANPQNAAVARQVVEYAGLSERVQILDGLSGQVLPQLPALLSSLQQQQQAAPSAPQPPLPQQQQRQEVLSPQQSGFDVVFLDHAKASYLPDLQTLEQLGLVRQGTTVISDNVIYPGAPGYLEYLDSSGRYTTELLRAKYEYEQRWMPDWEPDKEDALSVSLCTASASSE